MPSTVEVGAVAGTRATDYDYVPKVARLNKTTGWSDVIVFRHSSDTVRWQFRPGWTAPEWFACEWEDQSDRQLLKITLRSDTIPRGSVQLQIPLVNGDRSVDFPVEVAVN
jgi:hypothetical protein